MTPNQLNPQSMACKGSNATGQGVDNMQHVHTDGDTVLREKDHAACSSCFTKLRDTDLAHFISSVKSNASSDSPAGVVRIAQLGAIQMM